MAGTRAKRRERLGLFGGTFDPPHLGHLALAEWAREALALDRVWFIPALQPPHKRRRSISTAAHRLAMIRLATRGNTGFRVSTIELESEGPSYTADTVRRIASLTRAELFLLIGADSLDDFRGWHEPEVILEHATLAVAGRPGSGRVGTPRWAARGGRVIAIGNPGIGIASRALRAQVAAGRSIRYQVPDAVRRYIERHRLYR